MKLLMLLQGSFHSSQHVVVLASINISEVYADAEFVVLHCCALYISHTAVAHTQSDREGYHARLISGKLD